MRTARHGAAIVFSMAALAAPAMAADAAHGRIVFAAKCQACHGQGGDAGNKGGMKNAANFASLDANIPRIKTLLSGLGVEDHKKIVRLGGAGSGVPGAGAGMPRLGLTENDIDDVVAYERTLGAFAKSAPAAPKPQAGGNPK